MTLRESRVHSLMHFRIRQVDACAGPRTYSGPVVGLLGHANHCKLSPCWCRGLRSAWHKQHSQQTTFLSTRLFGRSSHPFAGTCGLSMSLPNDSCKVAQNPRKGLRRENQAKHDCCSWFQFGFLWKPNKAVRKSSMVRGPMFDHESQHWMLHDSTASLNTIDRDFLFVLVRWAGNEGMAPINHPLWLPFRESPGSFPHSRNY